MKKFLHLDVETLWRCQESNTTRTTSARPSASASEVWIALEITWSFLWGFYIWLIINGHHCTMRLADLDVAFWLLPELLDRIAQSSWMILCKEKRWESGTQLLFVVFFVFVLSFFCEYARRWKTTDAFWCYSLMRSQESEAQTSSRKKTFRLQIADETTIRGQSQSELAVDALCERFLSSFLEA